MATVFHKIQGKAFFPKLFEQNKDTAFDPEGAYVLTLILDDEAAEVWDNLKTKTQSKYDRATKTNTVRFRRKHAAPNDWAGGPPKIFNKDGSPRTFEDGIIWNDSIVEANVSVFDTRIGKCCRLESVTVLELAEAPEREEKDGPKVETPVPSKPKAKPSVEDDIIPF